jgi:hypothetical protein
MVHRAPSGRHASVARITAVLGRAPATLALLVMLALLAGCSEPPIRWSAHRTQTAPAAGVAISADGAIVADSMAPLAARIVPPPGSVCPGTLGLARGGRTLFGVWWAVRSDSGARLLSARSLDDGRSWTTAVPVDTTDHGSNGCARVPASIAADTASGYVHVAYALQGKEGPGLFFSHSMDGGDSFHEPVPIFYGERLGRASVAADGDVVAVAFEDPNSSRPRVGLALSRTMGHIFEARLLPVSDDNGEATHPMAAVRGRRIAVAWRRGAESDSATAMLAIKTGLLP